MEEFQMDQLTVRVFPSEEEGAWTVYLHGMDGFAADALPVIKAQTKVPFSLVTITLSYGEWSDLLAPWSTPKGWPQYVACVGDGPQYLHTLTDQIIPRAEKYLNKPGRRMMAGYSLAGLFALWSMFETNLFDRIVSASGSLWFPGFQKWFLEHTDEIKNRPESIYFSSCEEEYFTDNKYLSPVKPTTEAIRSWCSENGIENVFILDPGNHYEDVIPRTAAGIVWSLNHPDPALPMKEPASDSSSQSAKTAE